MLEKHGITAHDGFRNDLDSLYLKIITNHSADFLQLETVKSESKQLTRFYVAVCVTTIMRKRRIGFVADNFMITRKKRRKNIH